MNESITARKGIRVLETLMMFFSISKATTTTASHTMAIIPAKILPARKAINPRISEATMLIAESFSNKLSFLQNSRIFDIDFSSGKGITGEECSALGSCIDDSGCSAPISLVSAGSSSMGPSVLMVCFDILTPQFEQNLASSLNSTPQFKHFIRCPPSYTFSHSVRGMRGINRVFRFIEATRTNHTAAT